MIVYAIGLFLFFGPREVVSWLYHITPPLRDRGPLTIPNLWDVVTNEGALVLLTLILWKLNRSFKLPSAKTGDHDDDDCVRTTVQT